VPGLLEIRTVRDNFAPPSFARKSFVDISVCRGAHSVIMPSRSKPAPLLVESMIRGMSMRKAIDPMKEFLDAPLVQQREAGQLRPLARAVHPAMVRYRRERPIRRACSAATFSRVLRRVFDAPPVSLRIFRDRGKNFLPGGVKPPPVHRMSRA